MCRWCRRLDVLRDCLPVSDGPTRWGAEPSGAWSDPTVVHHAAADRLPRAPQQTCRYLLLLLGGSHTRGTDANRCFHACPNLITKQNILWEDYTQHRCQKHPINNVGLFIRTSAFRTEVWNRSLLQPKAWCFICRSPRAINQCDAQINFWRVTSVQAGIFTHDAQTYNLLRLSIVHIFLLTLKLSVKILR